MSLAATILDIPDILFLILSHLPLGVVARLRLVAKAWNKVIVDTHSAALWRGSYASFVDRVMTLDPQYRLLAIRGAWDADFTLDIVRLLSFPEAIRKPEMLVSEGLMTTEQLKTLQRSIPSAIHWPYYYVLQNAGLVAIRERLITPAQLCSMPTSEHVRVLFSSAGTISALRERLITPEQVCAMPTYRYVLWLIGNFYGIAALRERLITPEQASDMPTSEYLDYLFQTIHGITALRERLISPEQVANMTRSLHVWYLFMNVNGITALRERLISPEQIAAMQDSEEIYCLFDGRVSNDVLRQRIVTAVSVKRHKVE